MDEDTDVDEVGLRVAEARRRAGVNQTDLGAVLGLDKTQISKIERGRRRLDISEVAALASFLKVSTRELLGMAERSKLQLAARLASDAPDEAFRKVQTRARQLVEVDYVLSEVAGLTPAEPRPESEQLLKLGRELAGRRASGIRAVQASGKELADASREALGLGTDALGDLPDLIETYFGVDVALSRLGDEADGLCVHGDEVKLILASTDFTAGHVRFTLAHELAHHLFGDPREIIGEDHDAMFSDNPIEQRANAFAANFLMPEPGIRALLDFREESAPVSTPGVIALMGHFQVSLAALVYRLNQLKLLSFDEGQRLRSTGVQSLVRMYSDETSARAAIAPLRINRPPVRLHQAAMTAFANQRIGSAPIATLMERTDDDSFFNELMQIPELEAAFASTGASEGLVV